MLRPCHFASDFSRSQHSTAWSPAQVRFPPTSTRSFTTGSSDSSGYTPTFTKDTALSEATGARHGMCELARHGTAWNVWISLWSAVLFILISYFYHFSLLFLSSCIQLTFVVYRFTLLQCLFCAVSFSWYRSHSGLWSREGPQFYEEERRKTVVINPQQL